MLYKVKLGETNLRQKKMGDDLPSKKKCYVCTKTNGLVFGKTGLAMMAPLRSLPNPYFQSKHSVQRIAGAGVQIRLVEIFMKFHLYDEPQGS